MREIGYLRPDDDISEAQYHEKNDTVYADMTLFIRKLKRVTRRRIVPGDVISDRLQDKALGWYNALGEAEQEELDYGDIDVWCTQLERSKIRRSDAVNRLRYTRYTVENAAQNVPLTGYFDHISRLYRALDFTELQIKDWVYEKLYAEIASELIDLRDYELLGIRNAFAERQPLIDQKFFRFRPPPERDRLALLAPDASTPGAKAYTTQD